jgi:prepilin-type N-terminal cleavage/methylation domain-containing protein
MEKRDMHRVLKSNERGFTLVEMIVVVMIIAVLLSIAVGSYLGARERGERSAAMANVRAVVPSAHAYHFDNGTYVGMTLAGLKADYDAAIEPSLYSLGDPSNLTDSSYCVQSTAGGETYRKAGPAADIVPGTCP